MGIRARTGSDRLRTIWTPEMDRYFIDLMLEQVNKGNKVDDHSFSKRAWKHMTSLFNTKFKFQYEKDVLKNRHKSLRNLYRAVNNLLGQKGFSWDDTRQMVTADNRVWDEYIKVHPDARSYRIKTIPYYSDLCLVYRNSTEQKGDNVPELSCSGENETTATTQPRSVGEGTMVPLDDITIDEDFGNPTSKGVVDDVPQAMPNVAGTNMGNRTRTYWQPPMDRYFIELMLDQVQKGNRMDGVFRKQAWMEMIASFNAKFGFNYEMDVLKNRYKTLRRQYNVIKNLLDLDGFVWDDARQMVTADDYVWQDYIKAHTDARQFMIRPMPYYKDLCVICSDPSVDDQDSFSGQDLGLQNEEQELNFCVTSKNSLSLAESVSSEDQIGDLQDSAPMDLKIIDISNQKNKRKLEHQSSSSNKKTQGTDEGMVSALREMVTAVSALSEKKKDDENSNCISVEGVIEAVQQLPDMDEDLILDACDLLEDEKKAKTFLALDLKLRKKWLMRKLRPQSVIL